MGDNPKALLHLFSPEIMGVVLRGAFTEKGIASAEHAVDSFLNRAPHERMISLLGMMSNPDAKFKNFMDNFHSIEHQLESISSLSCGRHDNISRIESLGSRNRLANGDWHVDPGCIVALGIPVGATTEYLPKAFSGSFDKEGLFTPEDNDGVNSAVQTLPNDALLIMKGYEVAPPSPAGYLAGLLHRRPNQKISSEGGGRFVMHLLL